MLYSRLTSQPPVTSDQTDATDAPQVPDEPNASEVALSPERPAAIRKWLPLIGLALLAWVLARLDTRAFTALLAQVPTRAWLSSAVLFSINLWIKVLRWQRLLRAQDIELPQRVALPAFLSAQFYAQFTVGRVGEFLRIEALLERGVNSGAALASCVFDRLLDVVSVLCAGVVFGLIERGDVRLALGAFGGLCVLSIAMAMLLALFGRADLAQLQARLPRARILSRVLAFAHALASGMRPMLRPKVLAEATLWTLTAWYFYFAALFALADGLHVEVSRWLLTATASFAALLSILPVTISGLGARDVVYVEVLRGQHIAPESAAALSLLHFAVMAGVAIGLGFVGAAVRARQRSLRLRGREHMPV